MAQTVKILSSVYMKIAVNCFLIQTGAGYFLIDTGIAKKQENLVHDLELAGCRPGNLKLIILTHGDSDHSGNCAYIRERFGAEIGMHHADLVNVESDDMFANKKVNPITKTIARMLFFVTGVGKIQAFTPDLFLEDGQCLSEYGWDATVIHLPGHSKGSIGILTSDGDLFCGDLLENTKKPTVNTLGDDLDQLKSSVQSLQRYPVKTVYPGHGKPFLLNQRSGGTNDSTNKSN